MKTSCEVVVRTRPIVARSGRIRETLMKCGHSGRDFVVVKRNGLVPLRVRMCLTHARRLGDQWLIFTVNYWETRNASLSSNQTHNAPFEANARDMLFERVHSGKDRRTRGSQRSNQDSRSIFPQQ